MKIAEIEVKIACARREMEHWQNILNTRKCQDCEHWSGSGCDKAGGAVPPPDVQKTGCPEWQWNLIPF